MPFRNGKVINVQLAARTLEFVEFVGDEPAQDLLGRKGHDSYHMVLSE
jgi:hypothetical protein